MSEETEVKQDKEWLKGLINEEGIVVDTYMLGRIDGQYWKNENIKINKGRLFYLIDQLDGTEVLTQDWIDENELQEEMYGSYVVPVENLQNLLVPKQEVLSQDWIDKYSYNIEEYWEIADMMPEPQYAVSVENLQNLLVSNKKELDQAYKDGHDKGIELMEVMMMEYEDGEFWENEKMKKCIEWLKEEEYSNRKDLEE